MTVVPINSGTFELYLIFGTITAKTVMGSGQKQKDPVTVTIIQAAKGSFLPSGLSKLSRRSFSGTCLGEGVRVLKNSHNCGNF